ncbi:MAG: hypothetical protein U1F43_22645 [Myxococcota bacterium]
MMAGLGTGTALAAGEVPISALESTYTQGFDDGALANTGTNLTTLPAGWAILETGGGGTTSYRAGDGSGSSASGDTYSFGANNSNERALGSICSGTVTQATYGAGFTNSTGSDVTSVTIAFRGEQWRRGNSSVDKLQIQYNLGATGLATASGWVTVPELDFPTPSLAGSLTGTNGNDSAFQTNKSQTVTLAWPKGTTLWVRVVDVDSTGTDDGLAIDDFKLTAHGNTGPPPTVTVSKEVDPVDTGPVGPTSLLDYLVLVGPEMTSTEGIANVVVTDTLPADVHVHGTTFTVDTSTDTLTFTTAADGDGGSIVGQLLTVDVGAIAIGDLALVSFQVEVADRAAPGTISNTAKASYKGATSGASYSTDSNAASIDVVACVNTPSGTIPLCDGTIVVQVFFDTDGDGVQDPGEPGLSGWDFLLDVGDPATTGADGKATFTNVPPDVALGIIADPASSNATWSYTLPEFVSTDPGVTSTFVIAVKCTCPDDGDGSLCTVSDVCFAGTCSAGVPANCDDFNVCTTDGCVAATGCTHDANTLACDDQNPATKNDTCAAKACVGTPYTCTPGTCEATSVPNGTGCDVIFSGPTATCDDGQVTTKDDHCNGSGGCAGTAYTCTPGQCELTSVPNGTGCDTTPKLATETCNDGNLGTKDDHCDGAGACTGTAYTCTPSNLCERSLPDGLGGCIVSPIGEGESCDDLQASTKGDICTSGVCAGTPYTCTPKVCEATSVPNGVDCTVTFEPPTTTCDDHLNGTKLDHCQAGVCAGTPYICSPNQCEVTSVPNGVDCTRTFKDPNTTCNDGNLDTKNDVCNGSGLCGGTLYVCSPSQCELTSVTNGTDCTVTNKGPTATCDDANASTKDDHCNGSGACNGTPYTCTPSQCELTSVPNGIGCTATPKDTSATCTDGNLSTKNDHCDGSGGCSGTPYTCTPSNACETSTPDGATCVVTPIGEGGTCNDGQAGTRGDTCHSGSCAGTPYTCTPTQCQQTSVPNGVDCTITNKAPTASCDDGDLATKDDHCDGSGGCAGTPFTCAPTQCQASSTPNGTSCTVTNKAVTETCNDGNVGTKDDHCDGSGGCAGTAYTCTPGQCELTSVANGTGCTTTNKPDTATCDDANASTKDDHCNGSGACSGTAFTCTPTQCQASSVPNGATCTVTNKPNTATCDDSNAATKDDHCNGSGACSGTAITCTATQCQASSVPNGVDCTVTNKPDTATCNDSSATTKDDHCDGSGACTGTAYTCTPSQCELTSVADGSDCVRTFKPNTATCDDGNLSTRSDHCDGSGACAGTAFTCTPGVCESSSTPNGTDCTRVLATPGTDCDDGNACTSDDVCGEGGACGGVAVACEDGEICRTIGGCTATHCVACEDDEECGNNSNCLSTTDGDRCLMACTSDDDCGPEQVCREHASGGLRCFDTAGACVAPTENPDSEPEPEPEVGPEPVDEIVVEPEPDVIEDVSDTSTTPDTIADSSGGTDTTAEAKVISGGGGCAAGGDPSLLATLALLAGAVVVSARARRRSL